MNEKYTLIPIGILNRELYEKFLNEEITINGGMSLKAIRTVRLNDLKGAIERYVEAKIHIEIEWVQEYNELLSELGVKKNEFKL